MSEIRKPKDFEKKLDEETITMEQLEQAARRPWSEIYGIMLNLDRPAVKGYLDEMKSMAAREIKVHDREPKLNIRPARDFIPSRDIRDTRSGKPIIDDNPPRPQPPEPPEIPPHKGPCPPYPIAVIAELVKEGVIQKDRLIGVLSAEGFRALDKIVKK